MLETIQKIFTAENILFLLNGAKLSLFIAVCATILGTVLGILTAACKISRSKVLNFIGKWYVDIIRGTPMMLQLSFFYLGVPMLYQMITGNYLGMASLPVGIIAIGINSGAYSCELIRSAINSIDKGQWEAGLSIGLNRSEVLIEIVLPQSIKRIVPPMASEFITLIKDSSLVSTIGVVELNKSSTILGARYYNYFFPMIGAGIIYFVLTLVISKFTGMIERKFAESD